MDPCTEAEPSHPAYQLPRDAYWQLVHTLRGSLPPPVTDTPEDLARRDKAAIAQVASLLPANAGEAILGAQFVAAHAQAMDCLRLARDPVMGAELVLKTRAQAVSMMRQAQSAMRLLQRMQSARQAIEADNVAVDRAAWTEHCAAGLMVQALPGAPQPAEAEPPPPPVPAQEPEMDPISEAEEYAALYPQRAALIRRLGRVPDNVSFGPPDEYLVRALVSSRTPALLALDRQAAEARAP